MFKSLDQDLFLLTIVYLCVLHILNITRYQHVRVLAQYVCIRGRQSKLAVGQPWPNKNTNNRK